MEQVPEQRYYRLILANTLNNFGLLLWNQKKQATALTRLRRAEEQFGRLLRATPDDLPLHHYLAGTIHNLAVGQIQANDVPGAAKRLEESRRYSAVAVRGNPRTAATRGG